MGCCTSDFVTASDAEIDPSQRVNYSFGMVLGVDDFKQEHAWLAGRDERLARETIGYGVVAGLDVRLDFTSGIQIRVAQGLAVAPDGKLIAVLSQQCAQLDAWLLGPGKLNPVSAGPKSLYVVLSYAERATTPVPTPGEPCRSEDALEASSRIADGFKLDLSWTAPSLVEEAALQQFVAWLRAVVVQDAPTDAPSVEQFQQILEAAFAADPQPPDASVVIPRPQYAQYVSAAFDVWIRTLRPRCLEQHGPIRWRENAPPAEHSVLLARIDVELDATGALVLSGSPPALARVDRRHSSQLVHLRMLQEWLFSDAENDAPREAHYVIGQADPRLPNAQDLYTTFFGAGDPGSPPLEPLTHGRIARVDADRADHAVVVPAQIWNGEPDSDYYGPGMVVPIPVTDGGTGQAMVPNDGDLLVGKDGHFERGSLVGAEEGRNIIVTRDDGSTVIQVDTTQPIDTSATPTFRGLMVDELATGIVGSVDGQLVQAVLYDEQSPASGPYYYGPDQPSPIRIEDGGTGQSQLPAAQQILIGSPDDDSSGSFLLAGLRGGERVSVSLKRVELPIDDDLSPPGSPPTPSDWELVIDAQGQDIALPLTPDQGGTGLTSLPETDQLLVGEDGAYALRSIVSSNNVFLNKELHPGLAFDTVQAIHEDASPTFNNVSLKQPARERASFGLGWNQRTNHIVITPLPTNEALRKKVRLVRSQEDAKVDDEDDVLVVRDAQREIAFELPGAKDHPGRVLIFKSHMSETLVFVRGRTDVGDNIRLAPRESVVLLAFGDADEWLKIGGVNEQGGFDP